MNTTDAVLGDQEDSHGVATAVLVITTTVLFAACLYGNSFVRFRRRLPPGPRGWPILGSLPYLGTLPHRSLRNLSKKYGPIMFMQLGSMPTVVVSNADMASQCLKANDQNMASRPELAIPKYIMYGAQDIAYSPYGDHWRKVRKLCTLGFFTPARINQYQDVRYREVAEMLQAIYNGSQMEKPVVPYRLLANMSTNIITQMMWGKRHCGIKGGNQTADDQGFTFVEIFREVSELLGAVNIGDYVPIFKSPAMKILGFDRRMKAARQKIDGFLNEIIEEHQHTETSVGNTDEVEDFMHVLLRQSQEGESEFGETLSNDKIKAVLLDMLLGGTETSTTTVEWALTEVVRHPKVMAKAQDEIKSVVGSDRLVTNADIPNLKYLQAVIKETFRMHPAGPMSAPHKTLHDCVLGGYHIPAEAIVLFNIFAIQTDPAVWERPHEFDPDRFVDSLIDVKGQDFELIPFSAGRRMCPAYNLALAMVSLSLANLLHSFSWSLPDNQTPEELDMGETFGLTVPKAIPLTVLAKPRLPYHIIHPSI